MLTATKLYNLSGLDPASLGVKIIDPDLTDEEKEAAAISFIETDVLPTAISEVAVPFFRATGYADVASFVNAKLASMEEAQLLAFIERGQALFDAAAISYGRSELEKIVASNSESYDRDSDQNRIQGNQRLEKLLGWASVVLKIATGTLPGTPDEMSSQVNAANAVTGAISIQAVW